MPIRNHSVPGVGEVKLKALRWSREPSTRLQVFAIWAFFGILLVATKGTTAWQVFVVVSCACLAFFLWPFIEGPFLLRARNFLPLRVDYQILDVPVEESPQSSLRSQLCAFGFQSAGHLAHKTGTGNVGAHLEMFLHPEDKDSAQLAEVVSGLRTFHLLIFKTRFADGFAFETSNSHTANMFPPDPNYPVFRFPDIRFMHDQYRLHCKIKERFLQSRVPTLADAQGELAEFISRAEIVHQRHAQSSYYKLAASGDRYVYTWSGAIRHAWLAAWPIKGLRHLRVHSRGMKMARELGLPINPKFGRIVDSVARPESRHARRRT